MVDINGRWYPDYPGQLPQQDPAYLRSMRGQMQFQQAQQQAQSQQMQQPAIQQSGFVSVPSMDDVRAWPVAPGNSITFYVETVPPILATKTKGFSQLEPPIIKEFNLVEKEAAPSEARESPTTHEQPAPTKNTTYATKDDLAAIWDELDALKEKLKAQTEKKTVKARKTTEETEAADDE